MILSITLISCSAISRVTNLANKATLATQKVDQSEKKIKGKIANYTAQIQYDLTQPYSEKTIPVALQLATLSLALSGPPIDNEAALQSQVKTLLSSEKANQDLIARLQVDGTTLLQQNQSLLKDRDIKNANLVVASKVIAQQADAFSTVKWWVAGVLIFVVVMILLRIFLTMTTTGAAIAAKIP